MARTKITFASCNLYNLNLPSMRMYNNTHGWDQDIYDKKIAWTARSMREMPADVWGFQELWHQDALSDLLKAAEMDGTYTLLTPPNHNGDKIVCAGAVRTDILVGEPEWITNFPEAVRLESGGDDPQTSEIIVKINTFSRPVLHFVVKPRKNGEPIHVYVAHLKSKAPTRIYREGWYKENKDTYAPHSEALGSALSTIRRTAEATALRVILNAKMKNTDEPVVVLGDLNDGQHSNTLNVITGQPNYLFGESLGGGDTDLYTVGAMQQYRSLRDVYYTHIYQNTRESLDHILVSQEFYDNSKKRIWLFDGMEVSNDHLNDDNHKETGTTDHGIVRARFEYRPIK